MTIAIIILSAYALTLVYLVIPGYPGLIKKPVGVKAIHGIKFR